jgi:hypothetical protein
MTKQRNLLNDLDALIKRASEQKTAALKQADTSSKLDSADDGTSPGTTGAQAAANKASAGEYTAAAVDGGAKANPVGGSVENSTGGATAVKPNGQEGGQGAEHAVVKDADNGSEKPENKVDGKGDATGSFKSAAAKEAIEFAAQLRKEADGLLTPFDRFLVAAARSSTDPKVKTAAEGLPEDEVADQATDALMQQLESGQISDEEAAQILEEAIQSGAITEEDIAQAQQLAGGAEGAPEAAPEGAVAPEAAPEAAPMDPAAGAGLPGEAAPAEEMIEDPQLEAKMASAEIGPDHPKYTEKLISLYSDDMRSAYELFHKVAEDLITVAQEEKNEAEKARKEGDSEMAKKEEEHAKVIEDAATQLPVASSPEEKQALEAVKQEMGLNDQQLAEIMSAPVPAGQDKVASFKAQCRAAILSKVAALQI